MQKLLTNAHLVLCLMIGGISSTFASDLPAELNGIQNIKHPSENLYIAGQPEANAFPAIAKVGIRHVINLRPPAETPELNEAAMATQQNMAYYNIPVNGKAGLTRDNVILLDQVLRKIGNEKTLLHCSSANRVGALMALRAAWLNGASVEEALSEGERHGLTKLRPAVMRMLSEK